MVLVVLHDSLVIIIAVTSKIPMPQPIAAWEIVTKAAAGSERTMVL